MAKKKFVEEQNVYIPESHEEAPRKSEASSVSSPTVVVALCHPQGIQFLFDGGRKRVKLNGNAANLRGKPKGVLPVGGFGLSIITDAEWDAIKQHPVGANLIAGGYLFAHEKKADVFAEADDKGELRHGREPVDVSTTKSEPVDEDAMGDVV